MVINVASMRAIYTALAYTGYVLYNVYISSNFSYSDPIVRLIK